MKQSKVTASNLDRPSRTIAQEGSSEKDWSKTFHVDTVEGFVNGIFALHKDVFTDFTNGIGKDCSIGETVLYQAARPLNIRFEIKKIGYNEFQVRGAHFSTEAGVNICVGLNPQDILGSNISYQSAPFIYYYYPFLYSKPSLKDEFLKSGGSQVIKLVNDLQSEATNITKENFENLKERINEVANKLVNYLLQ